MSASTGPGEPADRGAAAAGASPAAGPAAPDDPEQLRQEIDRTREELGETVAELAAKADVKARARDTAAGLAVRVKGQVSQARQDAAAGAGIWRRQLAAKTAGPGRAAASWGGPAAGQVRSRAAAAGTSVRQATPERVKQAAAQGAGQARQHLGPLAAGAAAVVVGYLAFRSLRRR
jgi:hypothetical protein